jgi:CRP/FNR family transcriptional regulator, cyclic AMP receptor protein
MLVKARGTLAHIPLFRSLDADTMRRLDARCQWRRAEAKAWVIEYGEVEADVFFVVSGSVRVLIRTHPDREVILHDIPAGGFFGEMSAIDGQQRFAGVLALADLVIACMPGMVFREVLRDHFEVNEQLLHLLATRVRVLTRRIHEFSTLQVKHRLCAELLRLSRLDPNGQRRGLVSPPPAHAELAARVSTRREMVTRELKALERAGLLARQPGAIVITDVPRLSAIVEGEL